MHKDEAPVLQEYAMPLAHQALNTLAARYEFTPSGPILIEIFPKHDDFAVRTLGLPGMIGALGVCFGRVVTMDSPRARPPGEFQWEATLWHELAHVITLQMSNQRVPAVAHRRHFGLRGEEGARPSGAARWTSTFAGHARTAAKRSSSRDLNAAFQNPKTISLAYYQASLLVDHIVTAYGDGRAAQAGARIYSQGLDTDAALKAALNTDFDQLQAGFDKTVEQHVRRACAALVMPDGRDELLRMPIDELTDAGRREPAQLSRCRWRSAARSARTARPTRRCRRSSARRRSCRSAGGKDSPHDQMAAIAIEKKDTARAISELTALVAVDFNNVEAAAAARRRMLRRDQGRGSGEARVPVYERIAAIDPFDSRGARDARPHGAAAQRGRDVASREFRTVLALGPVDQRGGLHRSRGELLQGRQAAEAEEADAGALEIAPATSARRTCC